MPRNRNTNALVAKTNAELLNDALIAQGEAHLAELNKVAETAAETPKRGAGRPKSEGLTLAGFTAHVKARLTDGKGITFTQGGVVMNEKGIPTIQPNKHESVPVLSLSDGALTICKFTALDGKVNTEIVAGPVPAAMVLEFVKGYKPETTPAAE